MKFGMDYGLLTSSVLDCGFEMGVDSGLGLFLRCIKDFVSENNGYGFVSFMQIQLSLQKGGPFLEIQ